MRTDEFDYDLPPQLIAQTPTRRGDSRLLIVHRDTGEFEHRHFADLPGYLSPADILILNDTRVSARRLRAVRENGLAAEVLLLRPVGIADWEVLVRPGRAFKSGRTVTLLGENGALAAADIVGETPEGGRILRLGSASIRDALVHWGSAPLPPYIQTPLAAADEERYQTVYARAAGSAAAPTAGLHFTEEMLRRLERQGVRQVHITLHVGVGTFRPVKTDTILAHEMHAETAVLPEVAATAINECRGRVVAVGTTSVRTLESAAQLAADNEQPADRRVVPFAGETRLFITPGFKYRAVDAMITNFHLPRSTLLMLVSAFAGLELTRRAYREAVDRKYRFFSFGDAMFIV